MYQSEGKLFDWDPIKELTNIQKHGISFKEAASVFSDEKAIEFDDINHSQQEDRVLIIGRSRRLRIMVVCHCYRDNNKIIRIISARKATQYETALYGGV